MKIFILGLFVFAQSYANFSHASERKLKRARNKVITCAFRYVEQKRSGVAGADISAQNLLSLQNAGDDLKKIKKLAKDCKKQRRATDRMKEIKWNDYKKHWEGHASYPRDIHGLVHNWIWPKANCTFAGGIGEVGRRRGTYQGGVAITHCKSKLGLKFVGLITMGNHTQGSGIGITGLLMAGRSLNLEVHASRGDGPDVHVSDRSGTLGLGFAFGGGNQSRSGHQYRTTWLGAGVGLGIHMSETKLFKMRRLFPTGFDWNGAREHLGLE